VRVIAPFPPGGGVELIARYLCERLTPVFGQPCVVENKPGASGIIGLDYVAKAPPDGHTLIFIANQIAILPSLYPKLPFDAFKDLTPVVLATRTPVMIGANPTFPAKTFAELIAYAKAHPGQVNFTSCGVASPQHLAGEFLNMMAGIHMTHIPYKGCGPALADVLGGQVPVFISTVAMFAPHLKTGKLQGYATTGDTRTRFAPDLPTVAEAGFPGYSADVWMGLLAPAQTPRPVISQLNAAVNQVLAQPDLKEKLLAQSYETVGGPPETFGKVIQDDYERYGKVIRQIGIKPE
jgi:tripartite-type tricarboxylate transporter receptor subunit TctC